MMNPRSTLANTRVADLALEGHVSAPKFVKPSPMSVTAWNADICREPAGKRDRQVLFGDVFEVIEDHQGWSYGRSVKDGYVGYIASSMLSHMQKTTHSVTTISTNVYTEPDMKSADVMSYPFGAQITVLGEDAKFFETKAGFIPRQHLRASTDVMSDPRDVAKLFLGTPYLWGGNSPAGVDCSGLVQIALHACGRTCPGDSDQQQNYFQNVATKRAANQLYFWKGHVALGLDETTLIHANAHSMTVAIEGIGAAITRIEAAGDGPLTHHADI